jgi:hypothetical protein
MHAYFNSLIRFQCTLIVHLTLICHIATIVFSYMFRHRDDHEGEQLLLSAKVETTVCLTAGITEIIQGEHRKCR